MLLFLRWLRCLFQPSMSAPDFGADPPPWPPN